MLRFIICCCALWGTDGLAAQVALQSFDPAGATSFQIEARLSEVVLVPAEVHQIEVTHEFSINGQTQYDRCELLYTVVGGQARLIEISPTADQLEGNWRNSADHLNGSFEEYRRNPEENLEVKSVLTIRFPAGMLVEVEAEYGSIKGEDVMGLRRAISTYGAVELVYSRQAPHADLRVSSEYAEVDLALPATTRANLHLETHYGSLMTDFDLEIDADRSREEDYHQEVVAKLNGGGRTIKCIAPYNNVYLRKSK